MHFSAVPMRAAAICALGGLGMAYLINEDITRASDLAEHGLTAVARIEGLRWTNAAEGRTDFRLDVSFLSKDGKVNKASIPLGDEAGRTLNAAALPEQARVQYLAADTGVIRIAGEPLQGRAFTYSLLCCGFFLAAVLFLCASFRRSGRVAGVGTLPR